MAQRKSEVVTFKAGPELLEAIEGVPNRSEFIRTAVLAALGNLCPVCAGTGILTPTQQAHWDRFARTHSVERCTECDEMHLVCDRAADEGHADDAAGTETRRAD